MKKDQQKKPWRGCKGFLSLKCAACGRSRELILRDPVTQYECACGHRTKLSNLLPLFAHCECGKDWKYLTNQDETQITVRCINCGSPIDTELNGRGTAFVTMAEDQTRKKKRGKRR